MFGRKRVVQDQYDDLIIQKSQSEYESESQSEGELSDQRNPVNYPFSKKQIRALFREKLNNPRKQQKNIPFHLIEERIKDWIFRMEDFCYDFRFLQMKNLSKKDRSKLRKLKKCRRKVYLKFVCRRKTCMKKQKWTSYFGCFQILFQVLSLPEFLKKHPSFKKIEENKPNPKYSKIVLWKYWVYRESCKSCKTWGNSLIPESQLNACIISFGHVLASIMEGIKPPKNTQKDEQRKRSKTPHQTTLCEACEKGACFY